MASRDKTAEQLERILREFVHRGTMAAMADPDVVNASQSEKRHQQQMAAALGSTVPRGKRDSDGVEEDDDDDDKSRKFFDDLTKDDDDDQGGEQEPAKKQSDDDGADEKKPRKTGLPKGMHKDVPPADDITPKMIADRLNTIRSGKSLEDEHVSVEMQHYFDDLTSAERTALMSFLTGIAEIVTAGVEGSEADEPSEKVTTKLKKKPMRGEQEPDNKPKPKPQRTVRKSSKEDIAPPIQVGGEQATESIRRRMKELL